MRKTPILPRIVPTGKLRARYAHGHSAQDLLYFHKPNEELHNLYSLSNIIRGIK
jgi:hypothetical protein